MFSTTKVTSADVCYSAKIGILKQITTPRLTCSMGRLMFVTLQR